MRKGNESDFSSILNFINAQFQEDFQSFMPKIYEDPLKASCHLLEENKGIIGTLCYSKSDYRNCRWVGIGSVCVDINYRGQRIMSNLMEHVLKTPADAFYLVGDRQRYENFGFYKTGIKSTFLLGRFSANPLKVDLMENPTERDIDDLYELYQNINGIERGKDEFWQVLRTKRSKVYKVDGGGYLVYNDDSETVYELVGVTDALASLKGLMENLAIEKINVDVSRNSSYFAELYRKASRVTETTMFNLKIVNYKRIIEELLSEKINKLCGRVIVQIDELRLTIEVSDGVLVYETTEKPSIELTEKEMHFLLFGRYPIEADTRILDLLHSWFPFYLPVSFSSLDSI